MPRTRGSGWHKESKRHSDASIKGKRTSGAYYPPAESALSPTPTRTFNLEGPPTTRQGHGNYPPHPIIGDVEYMPQTIVAMREFRRMKPWSGTLDEKKGKFLWLNTQLNNLYRSSLLGRRPVSLRFWKITGGSSRRSHQDYNHAGNSITMRGKLSVLTYLHEFTHARGYDEVGAVIWSVNLFRLIFPKNYSKMVPDLTFPHMMTKRTGHA